MYRKNHFIKNKGSIRQLAVNEDFRNKGYGKFLASTAIKELNDMGAQHITLFCYKDNVPAQNLYNKMGFKKIEEHVDLTCLKHTTAQKLESTVPQQNNLQQTTNFKQATNFEKEFYDYL